MRSRPLLGDVNVTFYIFLCGFLEDIIDGFSSLIHLGLHTASLLLMEPSADVSKDVVRDRARKEPEYSPA